MDLVWHLTSMNIVARLNWEGHMVTVIKNNIK